MTTTAVKNKKITNVKNGDVENENVLTQSQIDQELQEMEARLKVLKAKKRELKQVGSYSLTMQIVCKNPNISNAELKEQLTARGIDCEKHKTTIDTTFHSIKQTVKLLGEFGHLSQ